MANIFGRQTTDYDLTKTIALPNNASTTVVTAAIDLGLDLCKGGNYELELSVPALNATMAPDTRTFTYTVESCTATNFSTIDKTLYNEVFTGASSAGIGAKAKVVGVPSDCARYVRAKIVSGASTADASTLSATFRVLT